jgi:hypothetical protein
MSRLQAVYVQPGGTALFTKFSQDWMSWSDPIRLSADGLSEVRLPAIAAAGDMVHATWMERVGDRYQIRYRGSKDAGANWSAPLTLSPSREDSAHVDAPGFEIVSDDDQTALADDGAGTAHAVWAVSAKSPAGGHTIWHAEVQWQDP